MMSACSRTFCAERIVAARRRLVDDDGERRLQRMREIADMGARPLDDLAIGVDQRVDLARQRRDLDGKFALQALGAAGADRRQALRNPRERSQAEAHLQRRGQQKRDGQRRESDDDGAVEAARFLVDLGRIAGHRDQVFAVVAEVDVALDQAQLLVLGALRVALPIFGGGSRIIDCPGAAGRSPTASARSAPPASAHRAA